MPPNPQIESPPLPVNSAHSAADALQNMYRNQQMSQQQQQQQPQQRDGSVYSASTDMQPRGFMDNYNERSARLFPHVDASDLSNLTPLQQQQQQQQSMQGENRMGQYPQNLNSSNDYPSFQ